jgi:O-antigen ligase
MQPDTIPDPISNETPAARRASWLLMIVAAAALAGDCFLNSPAKFSEAHQQDKSLLKPVVELLALDARWPTARGVEIRDLVFYLGAATLTFIAGFRLLTSGATSRLGLDDLLDFRRRASSPYFWWCALLTVSVISSMFSHAPDMCKGQSVIRFMHLAWWWPLAAMLVPAHARKLAAWLAAMLAAMAILALWYHLEREQPRLRYPIGNELFLAACLLPGLFLAIGFAGKRLGSVCRSVLMGETEPDSDRSRTPRTIWSYVAIPLVCVAAAAILAALYYTRSRSAAVGIAAGLVMVVFMVVQKRQKPAVILVAVLLAIGGALTVQHLRVSGVMGDRAHSIRARLNHEWPYALRMFLDKPVAGYGDGAYSMLAGQMARAEQLEDPAILSADEWSWVGHAHNEFLELLSDLGFVGMFAFSAALVLTIVYALRHCERLRTDPAGQAERWLVIGLVGALVALIFEECSDVALRKPGLPPVFLTIWALIWALVRTERASVARVAVTDDEHTLRISALRVAGTAVCVAAVALATYAVRDWRASRAHHEAASRLQDKDYASAVPFADFADKNTLDPFQRLITRVYAVWARSLEFDRILAAGEGPPTKADLDMACQALMRLDELKRAAPLFLRVSRLEADLSLNLSRAHERRGESAFARDYRVRFQAALERHREDEPFRIDVVTDLWKAKPDATATERLVWLRCLLRNGEIDGGFTGLFRELVSREDFFATMGDLMNVATQDAGRPPEQWKDKLSPETFRIAALDHASRVGMPEKAVKLAAQAEILYQRTGPRLFAAHSAALHEMATYRFDADPTANTDENLAVLAKAQTIFAAPADATTPLPGGLGRTRLRVLLAAGREKDAEAQIRLLWPESATPPQQDMANAYLEIAMQFAARGLEYAEPALKWAERAAGLQPQSADAYGVIMALSLVKDDDATAVEAAEKFVRLAPKTDATREYLSTLEARFFGSTVWARLRQSHPGLLPVLVAPPTPAPEPPSMEFGNSLQSP